MMGIRLSALLAQYDPGKDGGKSSWGGGSSWSGGGGGGAAWKDAAGVRIKYELLLSYELISF